MREEDRLFTSGGIISTEEQMARLRVSPLENLPGATSETKHKGERYCSPFFLAHFFQGWVGPGAKGYDMNCHRAEGQRLATATDAKSPLHSKWSDRHFEYKGLVTAVIR